jgi:glutamine amidotransferase
VSIVAICDYGAGNTRSVTAGLLRAGATCALTSDPEVIESAAQVVLPGVGSARSAMEHLTATGAADALRRRHDAGRAIIGICLGMQLALEHSEEDDGVATLGLVEGTVRRLDVERVPRLGWSLVEPWGEAFYFAHSYWCDSPAATATSDGLTAVVESKGFIGVQFHPEKSGPAGERWLASCLTPA